MATKTLDTQAATLAESGPRVPPSDLPPELADHSRYRVIALLGEGGMGVVYKAEHRIMARTVALKVISKRLTASAEAIERFRREVKAAAQLSHPNIVTAHDAEEAGGLHFLVMEYVEGLSLDRFVAKRGPLPVGLACHFVRQAALGLQHAHTKGMVHRDIKPHNLMVTRKGQVKILDFGLARLTADSADGSVTAPNLVVGTPDFLAPEQARDASRVDIRADLYALGCTLYYLLSGRPPFSGSSPFEKMIAHTEAEAKSVSELRADVPAEVAAIVAKLMAKRPDDRYQTPAELAAALAPLAKLSPDGTEKVELPEVLPASAEDKTAPILAIEDTPISKPRPRRKKGSRRPSLLIPIIAGAAVLALLLGVVVAKPWRWLKKETSNSSLVVTENSRGGEGNTNPLPNVENPGVLPARPGPPTALFVVPSQSLYYVDYRAVRRELPRLMTVKIASSRKGEVRCVQSLPPTGERVEADVSLEEPLDARDYTAVIFTGYRVEELIGNDAVGRNVRKLIDDMLAAGKPVAAMCTGQKVLLELGYLDKFTRLPRTVEWESYVLGGRPAAKWTASNKVEVNGNIVLAPNANGKHPNDFVERIKTILFRERR